MDINLPTMTQPPRAPVATTGVLPRMTDIKGDLFHWIPSWEDVARSGDEQKADEERIKEQQKTNKRVLDELKKQVVDSKAKDAINELTKGDERAKSFLTRLWQGLPTVYTIADWNIAFNQVLKPTFEKWKRERTKEGKDQVEQTAMAAAEVKKQEETLKLRQEEEARIGVITPPPTSGVDQQKIAIPGLPSQDIPKQLLQKPYTLWSTSEVERYSKALRQKCQTLWRDGIKGSSDISLLRICGQDWGRVIGQFRLLYEEKVKRLNELERLFREKQGQLQTLEQIGSAESLKKIVDLNRSLLTDINTLRNALAEGQPVANVRLETEKSGTAVLSLTELKQLLSQKQQQEQNIRQLVDSSPQETVEDTIKRLRVEAEQLGVLKRSVEASMQKLDRDLVKVREESSSSASTSNPLS